MSPGEHADAAVVVGLSGGVDSSVAALLLKRAGYQVRAVFMKNWEDDDDADYCSSREDLVSAAAAADVLDIELEAVNFAAAYREKVFAGFLAEYQAGRTPNPDVLCNSEIKFGAFLDYALRSGAHSVATGHYAQRRTFLAREQLCKGEDSNKDQSYFLYRLSQEQLAHSCFPIGHLHKRDVRRLAQEAGLANHDRKDSTGICFIGERPFRAFLARYLPNNPGEIRRLEDDAVVGEHPGLMYFTQGQREGLHIGGVRGAKEAPWFVAGKDMARNVLQVVQGHTHPALYRSTVRIEQLSWVAGEAPRPQWVYAGKTRYRMPDAPCVIEQITDYFCDIRFATPQWAVTPGQSLVLYESQVCLGGGIII